MNKTALFWLPRISSIIISYIAFAFLTESTATTSSGKILIAIIFGLFATGGIIFYCLKNKKTELVSLLPFGYWFGLFVYFVLGGFAKDLDFVRFSFLSVMAGSLTALSYYAWNNQVTGGSTYFILALLYLFVAFGRVSFLAILLVSGFLAQTSIGFLFEKIEPKIMLQNAIDLINNFKNRKPKP